MSAVYPNSVNMLPGPSCSKDGFHYPPNKSLSSGWSDLFTNTCLQSSPVDSVIHPLSNWHKEYEWAHAG